MVRHQPDYRMPLQILGSGKLADFLAGQYGGRYATMFNRYHKTVFASLADMVRNSGNFRNQEEMLNAWGHLAALGIAGYVLKPYLFDPFAQTITGDPEAKMRPRGPLAPIQSAIDVAKGEKDIGQALSTVLTPAPTIRAAADILTNRDVFGRRIINPQAPASKQLIQGAQQAGSYIGPVSTYGGALQPGSSKGTLGQEATKQFLDIKSQTPQQKKGQAFGKKQAEGEQKQREKKPRGPIEYYGYKGLKALGFKEGGPVKRFGKLGGVDHAYPRT